MAIGWSVVASMKVKIDLENTGRIVREATYWSAATSNRESWPVVSLEDSRLRDSYQDPGGALAP
jgi:hypothetical protein